MVSHAVQNLLTPNHYLFGIKRNKQYISISTISCKHVVGGHVFSLKSFFWIVMSITYCFSETRKKYKKIYKRYLTTTFIYVIQYLTIENSLYDIYWMDYLLRYYKDMIVLLILVAVYLFLCTNFMKLNTFISEAR